ncbi:hypothetical protein ENBRE01_3166, partial [Enteropsectra breve]
HFKDNEGKMVAGIREMISNDSINLVNMQVSKDKPVMLIILLPAYRNTKYFKLIRDYLYLTDSITRIRIEFRNSPTVQRYRPKNAHKNAQYLLSMIIKCFILRKLVAYRPSITCFGCYGHSDLDDLVLTDLAKTQLLSLCLIGADSTLDYFHIFKLFETDSELKGHIEAYEGTFGAAILLNELMGRRQIKNLQLCPLMQFKKTSFDMMSDPCYERLSAYFEDGDMLALPKAYNQSLSTENVTRKFEISDIIVSKPRDRFSSPAGYNNTAKSRAKITLELEVELKDIMSMVCICHPKNFNLINVEEVISYGYKFTVNRFTKGIIERVLIHMDLVKNEKTYAIVSTIPFCFKERPTSNKNKKCLIKLLLEVFDFWIVNDENNQRNLIFEVAESEDSYYPLRKVFINAYKESKGHDINEELLKRVDFRKLLKK